MVIVIRIAPVLGSVKILYRQEMGGDSLYFWKRRLMALATGAAFCRGSSIKPSRGLFLFDRALVLV
jgi:hypothetical protein